MTGRKKVVESYMASFARQDWPGMLALTTDDVERWEVGAPTRTRGKKELDREIRPGPEVTELRSHVTRMTEEGNVVVAEGMVEVIKKDGVVIRVQFCDIFEFEGEKIKRLTAFTSVV